MGRSAITNDTCSASRFRDVTKVDIRNGYRKAGRVASKNCKKGRLCNSENELVGHIELMKEHMGNISESLSKFARSMNKNGDVWLRKMVEEEAEQNLKHTNELIIHLMKNDEAILKTKVQNSQARETNIQYPRRKHKFSILLLPP